MSYRLETDLSMFGYGDLDFDPTSSVYEIARYINMMLHLLTLTCLKQGSFSSVIIQKPFP